MTGAPALMLRADAGPGIGAGHVMRCLALAQAWGDDGGTAVFAMASGHALLKSRLGSRNPYTLETLGVEPGSPDDARATAGLATQVGADVVVVDGYLFGADYQRSLREEGCKVLFVDDFGHGAPYTARWVLNPNPYAQESLYRERAEDTRLLLGCRFTLLRREIAERAGLPRDVAEKVRRILVTTGGSDLRGFTATALAALAAMPEPAPELWVVRGSLAAGRLQPPPGLSPDRLRVETDVDDMGRLMAGSDLGLSHAGTTALEQCCLGLPALLVPAVDNQVPVARELDRHGAAVDLGPPEGLTAQDLRSAVAGLARDPARRRRMSRRGQDLIDGQGASRTVQELTGRRLRLRPVRPEDRRMLWEWVQEPAVRAASFHSAPIPWEDHVAWFEARLADPDTRMYLALDSRDEPVGQVRFEGAAPEAVISVSLVPRRRRRGLGRELLDLACRRLFATTGVELLSAYIKPGNEASVRAFEAAGFTEEGPRGHAGKLHRIRRREG